MSSRGPGLTEITYPHCRKVVLACIREVIQVDAAKRSRCDIIAPGTGYGLTAGLSPPSIKPVKLISVPIYLRFNNSRVVHYYIPGIISNLEPVSFLLGSLVLGRNLHGMIEDPSHAQKHCFWKMIKARRWASQYCSAYKLANWTEVSSTISWGRFFITII